MEKYLIILALGVMFICSCNKESDVNTKNPTQSDWKVSKVSHQYGDSAVPWVENYVYEGKNIKQIISGMPDSTQYDTYFELDSNNRIYKITYDYGSTELFYYDEKGRVILYIDKFPNNYLDKIHYYRYCSETQIIDSVLEKRNGEIQETWVDTLYIEESCVMKKNQHDIARELVPSKYINPTYNSFLGLFPSKYNSTYWRNKYLLVGNYYTFPNDPRAVDVYEVVTSEDNRPTKYEIRSYFEDIETGTPEIWKIEWFYIE